MLPLFTQHWKRDDFAHLLPEAGGIVDLFRRLKEIL
jgi:hypothetical protein